MNLVWSTYAGGQLDDILQTIAAERSREDALRWAGRITDALAPLSAFPLSGSAVPPECFTRAPDNLDRLRQVFCHPYRIVYEPVDEVCRILAIQHCRSLLAHQMMS